MSAPSNIPDLLRKARVTLAINSHMLDTLVAVDTRLAMLARKHGGDVRDAAVSLRRLIAKAMDEDPDTLGTSRFAVKFTKEERDAAIEALSRHIARAGSGDVPEGDTPVEFFKSALKKI